MLSAIWTRATHAPSDNRSSWIVTAACAIGVALATAGVVHADSQDSPQDKFFDPFPPLPDITTWYQEMSPDDYRIPNEPDRVWFLTPSGLNCFLGAWGAIGCSGDIPGARPGDDKIMWMNGNRSVYHGFPASVNFPKGHAQRVLPPRSYLSYWSATCAVTPESDTYCVYGEFKFLLTKEGTYYTVFNDRTSFACNAYLNFHDPTRSACGPDYDPNTPAANARP